MKKIKTIIPAPPKGHWVGDGFPVQPVFAGMAFTREISPFLMLDYVQPAVFTPTLRQRGVGPHPHRGFETVTISYRGEIEHADSVGNVGIVGPGDVQWMTAGSGIVHKEMHSSTFSRNGGTMEMVQLWVNLPAKYKMIAPRYQPILSRDIPIIKLTNDCATVRVIAGKFKEIVGPASTFSPIDLWDIDLKSGGSMEFSVRNSDTTMLFVRKGRLVVGDVVVNAQEVALFAHEGSMVRLDAQEDVSALFMSGEPIHELIVARGPFVMNFEEEIRQAMIDYQNGEMGQMAD